MGKAIKTNEVILPVAFVACAMVAALLVIFKDRLITTDAELEQQIGAYLEAEAASK